MKHHDLAARQADLCLELVPQVLGTLKKMLGSPAIILDSGGERYSMAQLKILWVVSRHSKVQMVMIAKETCLRTPTVTHHANELVKKGMVIRGVVRGDRRSVTLTITPKGAQFMQHAMGRYREYLTGLLDRLPTAALHKLPRAFKDIITLLDPVTRTLDPSALYYALADQKEEAHDL